MCAKRESTNLFYHIIGLTVVTLLFMPSSALLAKTLKIGHILSPQSTQNEALVKVFKPYVEKATEGSLKIEVFPNEQLGHAPDQVEGVKMGSQAMFLGSQTWFEAYVKEIGVATIPFLFKDRAQFQEWVNEVLGKKLMPELIRKANQRIINLDPIWERGPFRVICSKKPIFTPEDIKGLKLRLWPAEMIQKSWSGLGASIRTIDFAEAYLALKEGVVNAITSPLDLVGPQKFAEVAPYITELRQYPQAELISINEKIWEGLTEKERKALMDGATAAGKWYNEHTETKVKEIIGSLLKKYNAKYILINRQPFVTVFRTKVIPRLIKQGLVKEAWIKDIESLK